MKNEIIERFSSEVDRQINQFGIDLIEDISNEIDTELESHQQALGLSKHQVNAFQAVLQTARQKVLAKYELETKNSRTDEVYTGEKHLPKPEVVV
jgi:hypothetical protein